MPYSSKRIVGKYVDFVKLETPDPDPDHKFYLDPDSEHWFKAMLRIRYFLDRIRIQPPRRDQILIREKLVLKKSFSLNSLKIH
jgi:hypothetical protein